MEYDLQRGGKGIRMTVKDGRLFVRAAQTVSATEIQRCLERHSAWISKHITAQKAADCRARRIGTEIFLYRGAEYPIRRAERTKFDGVTLYLSDFRTITSVYQELTQRDMIARARALSAEQPFLKDGVPPAIRCSVTVSKWGSYSPRTHTVRLSAFAAALPPELSDYLIYHELCHVSEPNHGDGFYRLLAAYVPEYAVLRARLRDYEFLMKIR